MDKPGMSGEELARYYEQERGDMAGWRHVERPRGAQRARPTSVFSVRFTQDELEAIQAAADQRGEYISSFIRGAALEAAKPQAVRVMVSGELSVGRQQIVDLLQRPSSSVA